MRILDWLKRECGSAWWFLAYVSAGIAIVTLAAIIFAIFQLQKATP